MSYGIEDMKSPRAKQGTCNNSLESHDIQSNFFYNNFLFSYCWLKSEVLHVHLAKLPVLNHFQLDIE